MSTLNSVHEIEEIATPSGNGSSGKDLRKQRILLADDSPQIRASLSKLLRNAGYAVTPVANGGQVLDRALTEHYDLLLLDLNMPDMDGWQTMDHLSQLGSRLPIIVITAQPDQREWAEADGASALMEKPLDLPRLLATIKELTGQPPIPAVAVKPAATPFRFQAPEHPEFSFRPANHRWE